MAKITQPDIYLIECDSHTIRILDHAICAYKDQFLKSGDQFTDTKGLLERLESLHDEVLRVLRDGHA